MRKYMQHGLRSPPRLIIEVVVFRESAGVHDAEMRTDARPAIRTRFTAIIEAGPGKATGQEWALVEDLPPSFGAECVSGKVDVISADVSLSFIVLINAARAVDARGLAANGGQLRKFLMKFIDMFPGIFSALSAT